MKKSHFVNLLLGVLGGFVFSIGMCMCLVSEWNAFKPGVIVTAAGAVLLVVLAAKSWVQAGRPVVRVDPKLLGKILLGVAGALVLGAGMCLIMVWNQMLWGIIVGMTGIVLLLCLIPACMGLK